MLKENLRIFVRTALTAVHVQNLVEGCCPPHIRPTFVLQNIVPASFVAFSYGDRTPKKAGFSKDSTFGPSFGRILKGKAPKSATGPPSAGPRTDFEALPIRIRPKIRKTQEMATARLSRRLAIDATL